MRNKFGIFVLFLVWISCTNSPKHLVSIEGQTMGTYYKVKTYSDIDSLKLKSDVDNFLKLFNDVFSTYIPDSEISKINQTKFNKIKVSRSMGKLLDVSLDIFRRSGGYFDITVGPLVNAWGFGPDGKQKKPSESELKELRERIGSHQLELKKNYLHLNKSGLYLDMSAIAKGFGVDELVKHLEYNGHQNFLVEIGGEIRTRGTKGDGTNWIIGIEGPSEKLGAKLAKVIQLNNMAMATSGSYRNFVKYGDQIFNHTIDPKTGMPAQHKTVSVTVLHEYCADADAWATALMSMGAEKGLDHANKQELMVLFQVKTTEGISLISTRAFDKYISKMK